MSAGKLIDHKKVLDWSENFKSRKSPFATEKAGISLKELEEFIAEAKQQCPGFNGLRIYLVRYPLTAQKARQVASKLGSDVADLSQPSLVLVPTSSFDPARGAGEDFKIGDDVFALAFADPDNEDPQEASILCPPRCP